MIQLWSFVMEPAEATTISWPPGPFCMFLGLWDEGRTVRNKRGLQALQPGLSDLQSWTAACSLHPWGSYFFSSL